MTRWNGPYGLTSSYLTRSAEASRNRRLSPKLWKAIQTGQVRLSIVLPDDDRPVVKNRVGDCQTNRLGRFVILRLGRNYVVGDRLGELAVSERLDRESACRLASELNRL